MGSGSFIYKNRKPLLFFLIPAFTFMTVFLYYPFIQNIINSFQHISVLGGASEGWNQPVFENYTMIFTDEAIRTSIINTLIMMVATVIGQVGIALVLALMVDNIKHGSKFFRTVFFFPIVISATALGLLFNLIFLYDKGMVNQVLESLGKTELIDWKAPGIALFTLLLPVVWQYVGFYFVIMITGLNNISEDLYEAAEIDGANRWQRVKYISVPLIHNVICTCVTLAVTGALKVFDLPYVMFKNGMPFGSTWLTGTYMYYQTFETRNIDYASTIAIVIVVLGVITAKIVNSIFKEKDY